MRPWTQKRTLPARPRVLAPSRLPPHPCESSSAEAEAMRMLLVVLGVGPTHKTSTLAQPRPPCQVDPERARVAPPSSSSGAASARQSFPSPSRPPRSELQSAAGSRRGPCAGPARLRRAKTTSSGRLGSSGLRGKGCASCPVRSTRPSASTATPPEGHTLLRRHPLLRRRCPRCRTRPGGLAHPDRLATQTPPQRVRRPLHRLRRPTRQTRWRDSVGAGR